MASPYFEPWVGRNYATNENRLLVLGESHYGKSSMSANFTKILIKEYIEGTWTHRFWTNIMQVVYGQPYWKIDRAEFWGKVAFYNYVQQIVAETAGVAPPPDMFTNSEAAFFSVLDSLRPKTILVLSKRLWENLPSDGRYGQEICLGNGSRGTWIYPYTKGEALATWLPHPSYNFSWHRWHPVVLALQTASSNIPLHTDALLAARR